jgi:hypothetical protein
MKKIATRLMTCLVPAALALLPATAFSVPTAPDGRDSARVSPNPDVPPGKSNVKGYKDGCKTAPSGTTGQKGRVLGVGAHYTSDATISFSFVADGYSANDWTTQRSYYGINTDNGKQIYQALLTAYVTGSDVYLVCDGVWVSGIWVGK